MAVTMTDAIIKSMKAYWKDKQPVELSKLKPLKYGKKYFDGVEKDFFGEKRKDGKNS